MDKAEKTFVKLSQQFEQIADQEVAQIQGGIDAYNKKVKDKTLDITGKATAGGGAVGAAVGSAYPFLKRDGSRKVLRSALKGGGIGAALAGAGALGYILPKAFKSYIARGEERKMMKALDTKHDVQRRIAINNSLRNLLDSGNG